MRMARGATAALVGALVAATALVGASAANAAPGPGTVSERSERTVDTAPARSADRAQRGSAVSWSPPLAGEAVGVTVSGRTVRLARTASGPAPPAPTATAPAAPPGC